jgi:SNF2 family DNA or RNA helicase
MLKRYAFNGRDDRQHELLNKLEHAQAYDRIAGYFSSSILDVAGEQLTKMNGKVRVVCNSNLDKLDVQTANAAVNAISQEWKRTIDQLYNESLKSRLQTLHQLLCTGKLEVRVLPDEEFGLMHGKAGVITLKDGSQTAFLGSANETKSGWKGNYEMLWEDDSAASVEWVQEEFDRLWNHRSAIPLSQAVGKDIDRLAHRKVVPLNNWQQAAGEVEKAAQPLVEAPIFRDYFGLWPHQKYFIARAFQDFTKAGSARLVLADQVGLGKTVQMAAAAMLMTLSTGKPTLIIAPKSLMRQWQEELYELLHVPAAIWEQKQWIDESGTKYPNHDPQKAIKACPRQFGIVSQGLITRRSEDVQELLTQHFECVIVDEAHHSRRKNLAKDNYDNPEPNNLMRYLNKLSKQCNNMILGTATPMQLYPVELHDLLSVLAKGSEQVLGNSFSNWLHPSELIFKLVSGEAQINQDLTKKWAYIRNPLPPAHEDERIFESIRDELDIPSNEFTARGDQISELNSLTKEKLEEETDLFKRYNPFVRHIIRRSRKFLEDTINQETKERYLKEIKVDLYGDEENEAIHLPSYLKEAYNRAEEFCQALSQVMQSAGFVRTMLLRRMGSSIEAGRKTAKKMRGEDIAFEEDELEDEPEELDGVAGKLTSNEREILRLLIEDLEKEDKRDPKYEVLKDLLFKDQWYERGCVIFSQYYDTANYFASKLADEKPDIYIGLYAGAGKAGYWYNGHFHRANKDDIKYQVATRQIQLIFGTDSAKEGINLQRLGSLINLDLPWNPTSLEQRKGRIQRIGQVYNPVKIYNMRYKDSVEDRVHELLSQRMEEMYNLFGQIPDVLEDAWVNTALNQREEAERKIREVAERSPFELRYEQIKDYDFESCKAVVNKQDIADLLYRGWRG